MTEQNILMGENGPQLPVGTHENILRESWQIILGKGDNLLDIHRFSQSVYSAIKSILAGALIKVMIDRCSMHSYAQQIFISSNRKFL